MNQNLTSLQESYLKGLRQITGSGQKKVAVAPDDRVGLGSRPKQQGKEYAHFSRQDQLKKAIDISNKAMLASFIFWLLFMYGVYTLGGYGLLALRVVWDETDIAGECQTKFSTDPKENLEYVFKYPKGDAGPYISRFTSYHSDIKDYPVDSQKLPPLVTGARSEQFYLLQGFIQHVHKHLKADHSDVKLIVYDLGLYRREREILQQYCDCEVRNVDYGIYPDHVADTYNFAWRPIIIQTLLEEFGAVVYADVTTRFKSSNSLNFVRARGGNDFMVWDTVVFTSVVAYTNKPTFHYINESRCPFAEAGMIDSQLLVFYNTNTTWHSVMNPWLKCALNADCIAPRWSRLDGCLHFRRPKTTGCHRYDMSVLSIILNRVGQITLTTNTNRRVPPRLTYFSDDEPSLFIEQPWTNTQIIILMGIPCILVILMYRRQMIRCLNGTIVK